MFLQSPQSLPTGENNNKAIYFNEVPFCLVHQTFHDSSLASWPYLISHSPEFYQFHRRILRFLHLQGPSMSVYPNFISIVSKFYIDFILIESKLYPDILTLSYRINFQDGINVYFIETNVLVELFLILWKKVIRHYFEKNDQQQNYLIDQDRIWTK